EADSSVIRGVLDPERQRQFRESLSARWYREHLPVAQANLAALHEAGVGIAFGTDSGPPARFQGYFEHLEMQIMADAGLDPRSILLSATRDAARCTGLDEVGTLEPGKWADFVVLREDPLAAVENARTIEGAWVAGNRVEGSRRP
ncbi:MAG TPA: amidohydrolase family protein, partial [Longimicrobiales bacterium]|nr:amidohydrolase family protein [Longimicrobiales bacterium]